MKRWYLLVLILFLVGCSAPKLNSQESQAFGLLTPFLDATLQMDAKKVEVVDGFIVLSGYQEDDVYGLYADVVTTSGDEKQGGCIFFSIDGTSEIVNDAACNSSVNLLIETEQALVLDVDKFNAHIKAYRKK
ncbi:MAG: hypothetical protein ACRCZJ_04305 [Erysipelotrichaceae bacterium]